MVDDYLHQLIEASGPNALNGEVGVWRACVVGYMYSCT